MFWLFVLAALMGAAVLFYVRLISGMPQIMGLPTTDKVQVFSARRW